MSIIGKYQLKLSGLANHVMHDLDHFRYYLKTRGWGAGFILGVTWYDRDEEERFNRRHKERFPEFYPE